MEALKIKLISDVQYFKEIYYENGQGSILTNYRTKTIFRITSVFVFLTVLFYFLGFKEVKLSWLFGLSLFVTSICFVGLIIAAYKYYTWKANVIKYLEKVKEIKNSYVTLKSSFFELIIDEKVIIERVDNIKRTVILPSYISIVSETESYLFPAKSMTQEEFGLFKFYVEKELVGNS